MKRVSIPLCVVLALFLTGCSGCEEGGGVVGPPVLTEDSVYVLSDSLGFGALFKDCIDNPNASHCTNFKLIKVDGTRFCGKDAVLVVQYEGDEDKSSCEGGVRQEMDDHLVHHAKVISVLGGDGIEVGSSIEFIPTELLERFESFKKGTYAIVTLIRDKKYKLWYRTRNMVITLDGKPYSQKIYSRPSDIAFAYDYSKIPKTLKELKPFIKEALTRCPELSPTEVEAHEAWRRRVFEMYRLDPSIAGEKCGM